MTMTLPHVYTLKEVAERVGLAEVTIKQYVSYGTFPGTKDLNDFLIGFTQEQLDTIISIQESKRTRTKKEKILVVEAPLEKENRDDSYLLHQVLTAALSFLKDHQMAIGILSMSEVKADMRIWKIRTPDGDLRVVAEGSRVTVLSENYQKHLEDEVTRLRKQVYTLRTSLSAFEQQKQKRTLDDYSSPLDVSIEAHEDGFLIWCEGFPFAATGKSEEEAMAAFHRVLSGYRRQLGIHRETLSEPLQTELKLLNHLLVDDRNE